ncbi:MAG: RNase adapter RapZ [Clostridia bacterium]
MKFVIVTGMSGAGKSRAIEVLEDMGYYCVDNMPLDFIGKFAEICYETQDKMPRVAIVTDIRTGTSFDGVISELNKLKSKGISYEVLFLSASDDVIIRRYKETRRRHPLSELNKNKTIKDIIALERVALEPLLTVANNIIDTSNLSAIQLKDQILKIFNEGKRSVAVTVISFGFKYGIPNEADMVFDVRCLPNPFYDLSLKKYSGLDNEIDDYVFKYPQSLTYLEKIKDMLKFLMPLFAEEGKSSVIIAIGCTGGRHRSVLFTEKINEFLIENKIDSTTYHRDMQKFKP